MKGFVTFIYLEFLNLYDLGGFLNLQFNIDLEV